MQRKTPNCKRLIAIRLAWTSALTSSDNELEKKAISSVSSFFLGLHSSCQYGGSEFQRESVCLYFYSPKSIFLFRSSWGTPFGPAGYQNDFGREASFVLDLSSIELTF